MKKQNKKILSLLMVLVMCLSLLPSVAFAAEDTSGLQTIINNAAVGSTVTLTDNYILTDTVTIDKAITIDGNGHSVTLNTASTPVLAVNTSSEVEIQNLTVTAGTNGVGIDLWNLNAQVTLTNTTVNASSRGIRFFNTGTFSGVSLTLDNSNILNSGVANGDYETNTTVGDTRGISVFGVINSTITLKNNSSIKGYGYSINTSADLENGVRPGNNTYEITDSSIWGWSAFNIWTVGNTFTITNSDLRGINPLTTNWNSFSTIVLNNGIYGTDPESNGVEPNKINISGGTVKAVKTTDSQYVNQTLFRLDNLAYSEFKFERYNFIYPVTLFCTEAFSAFAVNAFEGVTEEALTKWATESGKLQLVGINPVTYNWGLLAPGVEVPTGSATRAYSEVAVTAAPAHEGGDCL